MPTVPEQVVAPRVVRNDGSVPFVAPQPGVTPAAAAHLATKAYVDDAVAGGGGGGGGGAPTGAEYLVGAANGTLSAERVVTNTTTVTWDLATPGEAKAAVPSATTTALGVVELATDGESGAGLAVQANDGRLSDARAPTAHSHAQSDVTGLVADLAGKSNVGHGHAQLHDAATVVDSDSIDLTLTGQQIQADVVVSGSVVAVGGSGVQLDGDDAAPGASKYYGTDGAGAKGFHTLPGGGSGMELFQVRALASLRI